MLGTQNLWVIAEDMNIQSVFGHLIVHVGWVPEITYLLIFHTINMVIKIFSEDSYFSFFFYKTQVYFRELKNIFLENSTFLKKINILEKTPLFSLKTQVF